MFIRIKKTAAAVIAATLCMVLLAGCATKTNANEAAVTVNGETLNAGTANTYVRYEQAESYSMMVQYGLIQEGSPYWDTVYDEESGQTYGEYILGEMKNELVKMMLIRQHAADYGYSLSEEDTAKIKEAAAQFVGDNGSVAKWIGADQSCVEEMLSLMNYQQNTRDLFIADVDREVSDDEAAQTTVLYAEISKTKPDDYEGTDEEYAAEAKEQMEKMLETSKTADLEAIEAEAHADEEGTDENAADEGTADETAEEDKTFSEIVSDEVHAYSHVAADISENITVSQNTFSKNGDADEDYDLDQAVIDAAKTLADGEFYDSVIETDDGYYIVKMEAVFDADATESQKSTIISDRENKAYDELIQSWVDSSEVVYGKGFDKIKVTDKENYVVKTK